MRRHRRARSERLDPADRLNHCRCRREVHAGCRSGVRHRRGRQGLRRADRRQPRPSARRAAGGLGPDPEPDAGDWNWYDFEASYTATAADAGDPIEIFLSSLNNGQGFTYWADVRLTDSLSVSTPVATPEPATWAMMLIGFGGMAGVAAVRRRSLLRQRSAVGQLA